MRNIHISEPGSIDQAVSEALALTGGRLEGVVHNAGIATAGFFEDLSDEHVRPVMGSWH